MNTGLVVAIEHSIESDNEQVSLYDIVKRGRENGHDVAAVEIVHPRYKRALKDINEIKPFLKDDIVVQTAGWSKYIIGKISSWLELDSEDSQIRTNSELILKQETEWAGHLSINSILFPELPKNLVNYARCVNSHISNIPYAQVKNQNFKLKKKLNINIQL